jgi:hypothetical protein
MKSVWRLPAPDIGHYLPGGACSLDASPAPRHPIGLKHARVLHALVTSLSRLPHHPTIPTIVLAPWSSGLGWAAYVAIDGAARVMAGRTHSAHLFNRPCDIRCGPLMRLHSPVVNDLGARDLLVRTRTPLLVRGNGRIRDDGRYNASDRRRATRLGSSALTSTICSWMPRRVGLHLPPDSVRIEVIGQRGRTRRIRIGGHLGIVLGWEGDVRLRTNAVGEWLLRLGALLGVGGRVGFGFGRVEVERV